jgi:hypothetical protein
VQQAVWGHRLSNPLAVILSGVSVQETTILLNAISTVAALAVVGVTARKIGGPYTLTAAIIILLPLAYGPVAFYSMLRYMLVAFPQYPGLALICVKRTYDDVVGAALLLLQGFLMVFWSNWFAVIV